MSANKLRFGLTIAIGYWIVISDCPFSLGQDCPMAYHLPPGPGGRCSDHPYWAYYPVLPDTPHCADVSAMSYLNLNPGIGLSAGDFPAFSRDIDESTSALVSATAKATNRSTAVAERQRFADLVDLATGVPLIREVDFELPFGGAKFRHVRTFSEQVIRHGPTPLTIHSQPDDIESWGADGAMWDWNGANWCISENPMFLMDAQYCVPSGMPKRCYLLPDATHSIPFIWESTEPNSPAGRYVAPPWFDATCTRVNPNDTENAIFEIWLYGRSIKYTFHVPLNWRKGWPEYNSEVQWVDGDWHEPPSGADDGWHGIPYLGLVQKIEDRYGNRVEMTYTQLRQWDADLQTNDPYCDPCFECAQNSNEFGQLKAVKLYPANESVAAWTVLYAYRQFGLGDDLKAVCAPTRRPHHIHAIYAYPRDIPAEQLPADSDIVLHWRLFAEAESLDEIDQIEAPFVVSETGNGSLAAWVVRSKYTYSNGYWAGYTGERDPVDGTVRWPGEWLFAPNTEANNDVTTGFPSYALIKSSVTRRIGGTSESRLTPPEDTMYRYEDLAAR